MALLYFRCFNTGGVEINRCRAAVRDLAEAREHAAVVVRSLIATPNLEDWRDWFLHVSDHFGEEIFVVPFASLLGQFH
jgi:hypothetical protein